MKIIGVIMCSNFFEWDACDSDDAHACCGTTIETTSAAPIKKKRISC